jgi:hypothetical protein
VVPVPAEQCKGVDADEFGVRILHVIGLGRRCACTPARISLTRLAIPSQGLTEISLKTLAISLTSLGRDFPHKPWQQPCLRSAAPAVF